MSVGDRDYKQIVRDAIDSIGEDIEFKIDEKDNSTIYLQETTKCLRRSFYDLTLKGQVDMIKDDVILIFRSVDKFPENPMPVDILYVNACMWMFDKIEGVIVYITPDGKEDSFVTNRNQRMFEEVIRRTKVFHDLLTEKKVPIIEPSKDCQDCQYYERCYIKKKEGKQITLSSLFGKFGKEDTV